MKIKIGDTVKVTAGKDKGKSGEVAKVFPKKAKVLVKGVNIYKRHMKPRDGVEGGVFPVERPLPVSSVAMIDPVTKEVTRVGYKVLENGKKVRISKKSGAELDGAKAADKKVSKTKKNTKKSK